MNSIMFMLKSSLLMLLIISLQSCSENDYYDNYIDDALESVVKEELLGKWAFISVESNGKTEHIEPIMDDCGFNFFEFFENNIYKEVSFYQWSSVGDDDGYDCDYETNNYTWGLKNGVITIYDPSGEDQELVITSVSENILTAKIKVDIKGNGKFEVFTVTSKRYSSSEENEFKDVIISLSKTTNQGELKLDWESYGGFNKFEKYEVYRYSNDEISSAELLTTVTDINDTSYLDQNIPIAEYLNYFLKIYTEEEVLVGARHGMYFASSEIEPVLLLDPLVNGNVINLQWERSKDYYFSHYEVTVRNFENTSGYGHEEISIATIEDNMITSFSDETPPYIENPVYAIYTYNIFGKKSRVSYKEAQFKYPEILKLDIISKATIGLDDGIIYFYGNREDYDAYNLYKYNYRTLEFEAEAVKKPRSSTTVPIKLFNTSFGKELMYVEGFGIDVYDPATLEFIYSLDVSIPGSIYDFQHLSSNIWIVTTSTKLLVYSRSGSVLKLVNESNHYSNYSNNRAYKIIKLNENEVLIGHHDESFSYKFNIDSEGLILSKTTVGIPVKTKKASYVNKSKNCLINSFDNSTYDLSDNSFKSAILNPSFIIGASSDGEELYGTENDFEDYSMDTYEKEFKVLQYSTMSVKTIITKGFPMMVFENNSGEIISISSGFKRNGLSSSAPKKDIFIEVIK